MKPPCDFVTRRAAGVPSLDDLSPLVSWRILHHIAGCKSCAQTYFQMQDMEHAARALYANAAAPPPEFAARVQAQLALLPDAAISPRAPQRHEKKDKKMTRGLSFALAACAAGSVLFLSLREKPAPAAAEVLLKMQTALAENQTAHIATYAVEVEEGETGKTTRFGRLTKMQEWWNAGGKQRVEMPYFPDLIASAGTGGGAAVKRRGTIYASHERWEFEPETGRVVHQTDAAPQVPMGWKNYSIEQLAGDDNTGLKESILTDGGTRRENNQTIRTIIVQRKGLTDGPRWVCQIDADTNLPVRFDDTNKRGGKWITTIRYDFEFNRAAPAALFDPKTLPEAPPAASTFPLPSGVDAL